MSENESLSIQCYETIYQPKSFQLNVEPLEWTPSHCASSTAPVGWICFSAYLFKKGEELPDVDAGNTCVLDAKFLAADFQGAGNMTSEKRRNKDILHWRV